MIRVRAPAAAAIFVVLIDAWLSEVWDVAWAGITAARPTKARAEIEQAKNFAAFVVMAPTLGNDGVNPHPEGQLRVEV